VTPARKVVAVVMTYNCARLLARAYDRIPKDLVDEIIVTDDGSTDGSHEVARDLGVPAFRHAPNRGYGGNLKAGFGYALDRGADYVVEVHGDGQFDPAALRDAMPHLEAGADFIIGSRFRVRGQARKNGMPLIRYLANRGLSSIDRVVLGLPFTEFHPGFRIYSRGMLERVAWRNNADDYLFSFQIIAQAAHAGLRVAEVSVEADYRHDHTSQSIASAAVYAVRTFGTLLEFVCARGARRHSRRMPAGARASRDVVARASAPACGGCGAADLHALFDLGDLPAVNRFPAMAAADAEPLYPVAVGWCRRCCLVQLTTTIDPAAIFRTYQHASAASSSNAKHLSGLARLLVARYGVDARSRIFEVGSNDGTLLAALVGRAGSVLGVDPAANLAGMARARGVESISDFLTETRAAAIAREHGRFDLVIAVNVVAHTRAVGGLLRAIKSVLAPAGTFVMEAVDVSRTLLEGEFDTVYHEHVYCFSLTSLVPLLAGAGLTIVDVERLPTQGGSFRVHARHREDAPAIGPAVTAVLAEEEAAGIRDARTYELIAGRVRRFKPAFQEALRALHARHGRVIGLGAPARGVVLLNYCEVGPDLVEAVIDDTPMKQGRLVPGCRIPVVPWDALARWPGPAGFLLLSWNYEGEVVEKLRRFVGTGEILVPFPEIRITRLEDAVPRERDAP
jgi:SAM-dependent methyltransferase